MKTIRVDFVSDISCPWCVIGLGNLEVASQRLGPDISLEFHFQPFELEPDLPRGGTNLMNAAQEKFGRPAEAVTKMFGHIADRAAAVGFDINLTFESRAYNTFDAHRLLDWARPTGRQNALKKALFEAHFTRGEAIDDPEVLAALAVSAGLDRSDAHAVLASDRHVNAVRESEAHWRALGIQSVPSIILNERYIISGAQPIERFEEALLGAVGSRLPAAPTG